MDLCRLCSIYEPLFIISNSCKIFSVQDRAVIVKQCRGVHPKMSERQQKRLEFPHGSHSHQKFKMWYSVGKWVLMKSGRQFVVHPKTWIDWKKSFYFRFPFCIATCTLMFLNYCVSRFLELLRARQFSEMQYFRRKHHSIGTARPVSLYPFLTSLHKGLNVFAVVQTILVCGHARRHSSFFLLSCCPGCSKLGTDIGSKNLLRTS